MIYLVNPAKRGRKKGGKVKKRRSAKQKANDKRLGRMAKARAKAKRGVTKRATTKRSSTMAAKKKSRRRPAAKRRRSTAKRRSPVRTLKRGAYAVNPRRRRKSYRRNPGLGNIKGTVVQLVKDTAYVSVGAAAGRTIGGMIPLGGSPVMDAAKGVAVAVGLKIAASKFLGADAARFIAAGALQVPLKDLIVGYVPGAAPFLGEVDAYSSMASYSDAMAGYIDGTGSFDDVGAADDLSSYSESGTF